MAHVYRIMFEANTVGGRLRNIDCYVEASSFLEAINKAEEEARDRYDEHYKGHPGSLTVRELILIT